MKYDDLKWHLAENYPQDIPESNGLTHMGMFLGWIIDHHLESDLLKDEFQKQIDRFHRREITGAQFINLCCDDKLTDDDMNDEGNEFAKVYYDSGDYFKDYANLSDDDSETIFHEPDTWEKYTTISEMIDQRFKAWKEKQV